MRPIDQDVASQLNDAAANGFVVTGIGRDSSIIVYLDNIQDAKRVARAVGAMGREGNIIEINQEFLDSKMNHLRPVKNLTRNTQPPAHDKPEPTREGEHSVFFVRASMSHKEAQHVFDKVRRNHFYLGNQMSPPWI